MAFVTVMVMMILLNMVIVLNTTKIQTNKKHDFINNNTNFNHQHINDHRNNNSKKIQIETHKQMYIQTVNWPIKNNKKNEKNAKN